MIREPAATGRERAANCAVVPLDFLAPLLAPMTRSGPRSGSAAPTVAARRAPSSQLRTNITLYRMMDSECGNRGFHEAVLVNLRRDGYRERLMRSERNSSILESHLATYGDRGAATRRGRQKLPSWRLHRVRCGRRDAIRLRERSSSARALASVCAIRAFGAPVAQGITRPLVLE
jgi:hypothetical protein